MGCLAWSSRRVALAMLVPVVSGKSFASPVGTADISSSQSGRFYGALLCAHGCRGGAAWSKDQGSEAQSFFDRA